MARHCRPQKQTHQIAITALRSLAPLSGGLGPGRCGRAPLLAIAASSTSIASTKTSTSANASQRPGDVWAGRTAVPIVRGLAAVDDDCATACRPSRRHVQPNVRWRFAFFFLNCVSSSLVCLSSLCLQQPGQNQGKTRIEPGKIRVKKLSSARIFRTLLAILDEQKSPCRPTGHSRSTHSIIEWTRPTLATVSYLYERAEAFKRLLDEKRPAWSAITSALAGEGLTNGDGQPLTRRRVQKTWYAVEIAKGDHRVPPLPASNPLRTQTRSRPLHRLPLSQSRNTGPASCAARGIPVPEAEDDPLAAIRREMNQRSGRKP